MHTHPRPGSIALLCLMAAQIPVPASAAELSPDGEPHERPRRFGEAGELAISGNSSLTLSRTDVSGGTESPWTVLQVAPGVDWFPIAGLSLGARGAYSYQSAPGLPASNALSMRAVRCVRTFVSVGDERNDDSVRARRRSCCRSVAGPLRAARASCCHALARGG